MEYPKGTWWHEPEVAYETGYEAGIRKVVDWVEIYAHADLIVGHIVVHGSFMLEKDKWQDKLKEWGINP